MLATTLHRVSVVLFLPVLASGRVPLIGAGVGGLHGNLSVGDSGLTSGTLVPGTVFPLGGLCTQDVSPGWGLCSSADLSLPGRGLDHCLPIARPSTERRIVATHVLPGNPTGLFNAKVDRLVARATALLECARASPI